MTNGLGLEGSAVVAVVVVAVAGDDDDGTVAVDDEGVVVAAAVGGAARAARAVHRVRSSVAVKQKAKYGYPHWRPSACTHFHFHADSSH